MPRQEGAQRQDPYWKRERSWRRHLDPRHPLTRCCLGATLAWLPFLGPPLVMAFLFWFGCAAGHKSLLIFSGVMCATSVTFARLFALRPPAHQHTCISTRHSDQLYRRECRRNKKLRRRPLVQLGFLCAAGLRGFDAKNEYAVTLVHLQ